jgi:hypothetical protein
MNRVAKELPENNAAVAKWLAESSKAKPITDVKGKLKLNIPLIPLVLSYEKELSVDLKRVFNELWEDLTTGQVLL